jgi:hypothetical protein
MSKPALKMVLNDEQARHSAKRGVADLHLGGVSPHSFFSLSGLQGQN